MWRANQPSPRQVVAHARERGIRTIINLRGASTKGYYLLEKEACEAAGIALVDFQVFSRDTPTRTGFLMPMRGSMRVGRERTGNPSSTGSRKTMTVLP